MHKAHEHTQQATQQASELELLEEQYDTSTEKYRLDLELSDDQRQAKMNAAKQKVAAALNRAELLRQDAMATAQELQPIPEPPPVDDPLAIFLRQHALYKMTDAQRRMAFETASMNGDRLTYEAVISAPPWLHLASPDQIRMGREYWGERHSIHPSPHLPPLSAAVERLSHAVTRLRCRIA